MLADGTVTATSCSHSNYVIYRNLGHCTVRAEAGQGNPWANHNSKILNLITDECRPEM